MIAKAVAVGRTLIPFLGLPASADAQTYTADPGAWRPVAYSDLLFPIGEAESYASIWQDRLDESNRRPPPAPSPDQPLNMSSAVGNRGATEWHYSINFQTKLVALTVLDTPWVCTDEYPSPSPVARIKVCPMRLVTIEGDHYSVANGAACYLEKQPNAPFEDSTASATYAAYDVATRSIKLRYTVAHQEIAPCAQSVPLHPPQL
jgi:hypothetical protein